MFTSRMCCAGFAYVKSAPPASAICRWRRSASSCIVCVLGRNCKQWLRYSLARTLRREEQLWLTRDDTGSPGRLSGDGGYGLIRIRAKSIVGRSWQPKTQQNRAVPIRRVLRDHLDYRHTFGSQFAQKGVSLYKISSLMGNSPEISRRHYASVVPETMES